MRQMRYATAAGARSARQTLEMETVMIVGKVVGSIISTRKNEKLVGNKLMVIEQVLSTGTTPFRFVAIDTIGAGIGETVLVAMGSAARIGTADEGAPIDAAIVGIVDEGSGLER